MARGGESIGTGVASRRVSGLLNSLVECVASSEWSPQLERDSQRSARK
jgi:hypothetical protein